MGSQKVGHDWATEHLYVGFLQFYGVFSWIFFGFLFFFLLDFSCCGYSLIYRDLFVYFYLTSLFYFFPLLPLHLTVFVSLFSLLYSAVGTLLWPYFLVCVLVLLLIDQCHFWFHLLTRPLSCTFLPLDSFGFLCVCVCVCVRALLWFCYYLSDFVFTICPVHFLFLVLFHCLFLCVCFNPL